MSVDECSNALAVGVVLGRSRIPIEKTGDGGGRGYGGLLVGYFVDIVLLFGVWTLLVP